MTTLKQLRGIKEEKIETITMDIPLFIRALEFAREDAIDDEALHRFTEKAIELSRSCNDPLMMNVYNQLIKDNVKKK